MTSASVVRVTALSLLPEVRYNTSAIPYYSLLRPERNNYSFSSTRYGMSLSSSGCSVIIMCKIVSYDIELAHYAS
jgi:hypothetical protein